MLKIAIVGCGKIADSHALQLRRISDCRIVAACDNERLMAEQFCERFSVEGVYDNLSDLLEKSKPDVVHITTPPQSHFKLGKQCLEAGCHIYVEKPFTVDTREAKELIDLANARGKKITAGHDEQFSHAARRMRALVRDGYLGGNPIHMESTWCYDMGNIAYARSFLGDAQHWVRRLPGKLLHNLISHGVAKIAEYLVVEYPKVEVIGFTSSFLKSLREKDTVDELRVVISAQDQGTAYFTFSTQMKPTLHEFKVFGPKNGLWLDVDTETLIRLNGKRGKSYLAKFGPQASFAKQYFSNLKHNLGLFLGRDFHMDSSKKYLFEAFYRSILHNSPPPIPYREILLTSWIMDSIFEQLYGHPREHSILGIKNPPVAGELGNNSSIPLSAA